MIIRVQSSAGTKRIEVSSSDTLISLHQQVEKTFSLESNDWGLYKSRDYQKEIKKTKSKLKTAGLNHGDMLYLKTAGPGANDLRPNSSGESVIVIEDEIDVEIGKMDGRIRRDQENKGMFKIENLPIEPWDEAYLKEKEIKFLSFHAYMRQQTAGVDKGKYFRLENFKAARKLDANSTQHSVVDLPSAVTLNRQKFRHVDNIVFENREIVDRFLNYWRNSGNQRMGFLYGRYTPHSEVPLGIKAEVCAIYEPPQESTKNSLQFHPDPNEEAVEYIARKLNLQKIGWILSDLTAADPATGTVKNTRHSETHFLTAEECITAATFQNRYPNPCKLAPNGKYGSKFTTVIVSGDNDCQISFEGYQVSNQGMSLVADNCLVPTLDAPELGYIMESSPELFVSDVYYKQKDKYGNEITKLARPLPLEYLLTDVPTAFSLKSQFTCSNSIDGFAASNRDSIGEMQSLSTLSKYLNKFKPEQFVDAVSDFHLLVYLYCNDTISFKNEMDVLLDAVCSHDNILASHWKDCASWSTLEELMRHS
uniref:Nuclear protein localization protein 4 homolog n=1 Tax=Ciona savignyi TaxID=51511 RepID=H2Z4W5_CIOSA